jgi:hypothetical protein
LITLAYNVNSFYEASERRGLLREGLDVPIATRAVYAMIDHVVAGFPVDTPVTDIDRTTDQVAGLVWHAMYRSAPEDAPSSPSSG